MFLCRYTRTKDGKQHAYYALVESVRTDAGPRQHVVAYLRDTDAGWPVPTLSRDASWGRWSCRSA